MRIIQSVIIVALSAAVGTAIAAERLTSEQIADLRSRGDRAAFQQLKEEYRKGGDLQWSALEGAIAIGGEQGLDLAAEVIDQIDRHTSLWAASAVTNAMNEHDSERAMQMLRQAVAVRANPADYRDWQTFSDAWGAMFYRMQGGPESIDLAISRATDVRNPSVDRALALQALRQLGPWDDPQREKALDAYRPFLNDADPDMRLAAVHVNSGLWDSKAIEQLKALAWGSDPRARLTASSLVVRYLKYGHDRPKVGQSTLSSSWRRAHLVPFDAAGLTEWRSRSRQWADEQHRLLTGEDPPPESPINQKGTTPATAP